MKKILFSASFLALSAIGFAQNNFTVIKNNATTSVKNQGQSGTCWCYSSTAMTESDALKNNVKPLDISETFTVYNLYLDKAIKYIRRQGNTRFTEGGLGQDMVNAVAEFGAVPQEIYPGIGGDTIMKNDYKMQVVLKKYLDSVIEVSKEKLDTTWINGYTQILQSYLGTPPSSFQYDGKEYTPKSFAKAFIKEQPSDFIGLTSFTHHPFYSEFAMEVPDNYNSNMYYNLPLEEFIRTTKDCIEKGYTLTWDADVSNMGFRQGKGIALLTLNNDDAAKFPAFTEPTYTQQLRQQLFDEQITQDDHLMQITGLAKDENGNEFFIVKNSWGEVGPHKGYIYVSIPYFAINTISVVVNKKAVPKKELDKLKVQL